VFAGAAREAVFSNPAVIRRVHADFVPVALKAGLVNNPPDDTEGRLYREIVRSKIVPQGICVINSAGKVLAWTAMFDDDKSVLAFFDHCLKRFAQFPDAKKPFPAQRYLKFPSAKLPDIEDTAKVPAVVERHPKGKSCPATTRYRQGTILARLFGRALDKSGKPVTDTVRQEHYVEDRFHVPVAMQEALAKAVKNAGTGRFRLADDLARLLVSHAFLGQLDVDPVNPPGGVRGDKGNLKQCELWAHKDAASNGLLRVRVEGKSEAAGGSSDGQSGDGRIWRHQVKLTWQGIIEMKETRMRRLLLMARGSEKLKWGNTMQELKSRADVTQLPGGHAIDLACGVRYGIVGEPISADQVGAEDPAGAEDQGGTRQIPDEARKQLAQALGVPFIVFRDKVQEELKLSDHQKQKLLENFRGHIQKTMIIFEKIKDLKAEEREKEMQSHRRKSHKKLAAFLKETLKAEQLKRLQQLELRQEGLFALGGRPNIVKELKITDEQRKQFMGVVQEMQKKIEPLIQKAQSGGNPQEIGPKVMKIRKEHEGKIEAILSDAQKKQWKNMLGKPFDLGD
jgi:hypothetical protein